MINIDIKRDDWSLWIYICSRFRNLSWWVGNRNRFSFCRRSRCGWNICEVGLVDFWGLVGKRWINRRLFLGILFFLIRIWWRIGSFFGWKMLGGHLLIKSFLFSWTRIFKFICLLLSVREIKNEGNVTIL